MADSSDREPVAVRLVDGGPSHWSHGGGWRASQSTPVIDGLSDDEAGYLVNNYPFEYLDGSRTVPESLDLASDADADADSETESDVSDATETDTDDRSVGSDFEDFEGPPFDADPADSPFDAGELADMSVRDDLEPDLESGSYTAEELLAIGAQEADGKGRSTAFDAINEALRGN